MGCCKSCPQDTTTEGNTNMRTIQIDGYRDIRARKGMKTGAQLGRTDDGDFEGGLQIMFLKRRVKNYTQSIPAVSQ